MSTATDSSTSSSLGTLLSLASSLHNDQQNGVVPSLSLRQLVPVHDSLCKSVVGFDTVENDAVAALTITQHVEVTIQQQSHVQNRLDAVITTLFSEKDESEATLCRHVLHSGGGSDKRQLLAVQYLVFLVRQAASATKHDSGGLVLASVVLPFLLSYPQLEEDMIEAVLDAALGESTTRISQQWLDVCLVQLRNDADSSSSPKLFINVNKWTLSCRILVRLWHACQSPQVIQCMHDKVIRGMESNNLELLRPGMTSLLPLLYTKEQDQQRRVDQERTDGLWMRLMKLSINCSSGDDDVTPLIVTAILCAIVPSLLSHELPELPTMEAEQRVRPVHQSMLWKLIYSCLCRGMDQVKLTSGFGQNTTTSMDQMLRRRGIYILRLLVEKEQNTVIWIKYVLCFEALEMESEQHLVDQVWHTVGELCEAAALPTTAGLDNNKMIPPMTWDWISALLSRVLLSEAPVLRKLGLYRFLNGHVGVCTERPGAGNDDSSKKDNSSVFKLPQKKHAIKGGKRKATKSTPLRIVSTDFVLNVMIPSYDSLCGSIGTIMQYEENGRIHNDDITPTLATFLGNYLRALAEDDYDRVKTLVRGLLGQDTLCRLRAQTALLVYRAIAETLLVSDGNPRLPIDESMTETAVQSFQLLFGTGSIVLSFRKGLLRAFAIMLSRSSPDSTVHPKTLLKILALYNTICIPDSPSQTEVDGSSSLVDDVSTVDALQQWLANMGNSPSWACNVGAACASAFVSGQLLPFSDDWDPETGITETEREMGGAISLMCTFAAGPNSFDAASQLLWPAIHKGLSFGPSAAIGTSWPNAHQVTRGLILLEFGCRLGILSGLGNGDLVVDRQNQMMPPPPNIEALLAKSVEFILCHMKALTSWGETGLDSEADRIQQSGSTRSGATNRVSTMFALLIGQMKTLHEAYPSSMVMSTAVDDMLQISIDELMSNGPEAVDVVKYTALSYAALSCGADPTSPSKETCETCRVLLALDFLGGGVGISKAEEQAARSVFQYAKWGTLSLVLPALLGQSSKNSGGSGEPDENLRFFLDDLFTTALDAVHATPVDALLPLFDCVLIAARRSVTVSDSSLYAENIEKIISTLFAIMEDSGRTMMYMLNEICALIFRPQLLFDEFERMQNIEESKHPIRDCFHRLMDNAGKTRPHISKCVVSWITIGWLGSGEDEERQDFCGLAAIPYREDIANLLLHKECRLDESSAHQEQNTQAGPRGGIELPPETSDLSIVRGFLLFFISRLPDPNDGLPQEVLTDLLHSIIFSLFDNICMVLPKTGSMLMTGSTDYCRKMRAWQALCVLSRFVTVDIADAVCHRVFDSLSQNIHGQIRYFMEIFAIQCSRKHPAVFGNAYIAQVRRRDLSLQHISSLMIIGGNLIVGRYRVDFFRQFGANEKEGARLHEVLAGVIPWLSSTQGFSRAIAQLLVHELIPLVLNNVGDVRTDAQDAKIGDSDWFLQSIYAFLEDNPEMKRLRKKQSKYFDRYDVDALCTVEGVLSVPVDTSDEANPLHMVEAIKRCLEEVYHEAHEHEAPVWKQVEDMLMAEKQGSSTQQHDTTTEDESSLVNFQRKILPLDSLNLALEESREQRLRNATGRRKQQLIVCASLIDKIPNLAGLARTAEIFAADRLVIPDVNVCRMDNFKSISVGAGEWIEIEECKEDHLLSWLRQQKEKGYHIVGLEQTSSSVSIDQISFPERTVLLLGKEKEGIPVELLQEVDECIEIPQLGIIRSLNVHVSGAVAIWEYSKQMRAAKNGIDHAVVGEK